MASSVLASVREQLTTITVNGEFCFELNSEFRDAYKQAKPGSNIIVDLENVDRMDSAALGMLVQLREHVGENKVKLVNPRNEIKKILEIANFGSLFEIQ